MGVLGNPICRQTQIASRDSKTGKQIEDICLFINFLPRRNFDEDILILGNFIYHFFILNYYRQHKKKYT